jgi:hypothetical protein
MKIDYKWYDYSYGITLHNGYKFCFQPYKLLKPKPTPINTVKLISFVVFYGILLSFML